MGRSRTLDLFLLVKRFGLKYNGAGGGVPLVLSLSSVIHDVFRIDMRHKLSFCYTQIEFPVLCLAAYA